MEDYSDFIPNVHFEKIPIKNLVSSQDYQRTLSRSHIERAAADFDVNQINPVKVSRRDGTNYVFNGQHTVEIVAFVSGSRDTPVWCMVFDDLSYKAEADIFANQQKYVKALLPYEVFVGNIEAGNEDQLIIRDLVKSYGLRLGSTKAPGVICAVATLERIYRKYGYHILDRTLRLIIGTWEGENGSLSGNTLNAVAKLCSVFGAHLNDETFKAKLGTVSMKQLIRTAKERRSGSMGVAEAIIIEYNGRKKTLEGRLSLSELYARDSAVTQAVPSSGKHQEDMSQEAISEAEIYAEEDWYCE